MPSAGNGCNYGLITWETYNHLVLTNFNVKFLEIFCYLMS